MTKARILEYKNVQVTIKLVKNNTWRWFAHVSNEAYNRQIRLFGLGSNKFFARSFAKDIKKLIDEEISKSPPQRTTNEPE